VNAPRRPWRRALVAVLAASGLALGAAAAAAAPGQPGTSQPAGARTVRAPAAVKAAAACNANASSLRPSGPPQVTSGSFMAKVRARGYLIAGVDQSTYHFGFLNPLTNQIEGFDIDVIRAVAKAIFGHADASTIHYKAISDAQRIPDILSGTVDIVAHTMTITCDRLKSVDFSAVYFEAHQKVLVLKDSTATSLASLHGQKVCATSGSDSVTKIGAARATAVEVPYWTDCLVLLQQGAVAAISTDDSILDGLAAQDPYTKLIGDQLTDEPYGLAISKQHPEFVRFVNAVLQQYESDGQWKNSYQSWLGLPQSPPKLQYAS
jgi:polar amino acid transport system substrate-binding protein